MQTSTIVVLLCLIAVVVARAQEPSPLEAAQESLDTPAHDRSPRNKRGLLMFHKKLILGALGLKAAKIGAVGAAGVVGALALKAKSKLKPVSHSFFHHGW